MPLPDEYMTRSGKIFQLGDHPDQHFSLTEAEADAAIAAFSEAPIDLEHTPTVLSGKLGSLAAVRRAGKDLIGDVRLPTWLDNLVPDGGFKVSATLDRATKHIKGLALTLDPIISDAAVFSAYAQFAGKRNNATDMADIQKLHDLSAGLGAACDQKNANYSKESQKMSFAEKLKAWITGGMEGDLELADEKRVVFAAPAAPPAPVAVITEDRQERDALKAELGRLKLERINEQAAQFAREVIEIQHRAFPNEHAAIIDAYSTAALDDLSYGPATFSGGRSMTRVKALENAYAARPANQLTADMMPQAVAEFANRMTTPKLDADGRLSREQYDELLGKTGLGRNVLNGKQQN